MILSTCISGTLAPFVPSPQQAWDERRVRHLFRRTSYGVSHAQIKAALSKSPSQVVDELIDAALRQAPSPKPFWADYLFDDFRNEDKIFEEGEKWGNQWVLQVPQRGLHAMMTFFWSNHFVTQLASYEFPTYAFNYVALLEKHAMGNFKDFTRAIGINAAMLIYLNGAESFRGQPNENYARELLELFTLGRDNGYTQRDIEEIARAFTGWTLPLIEEIGTEVIFLPSLWDSGEKTIFGRTANFGYHEVIDLLFEERREEIAQYICTKLYQHFVYQEEVDTAIINELAATFLQHDFEIEAVLRQLLKSEHFFADEAIGIQVSSPLHFLFQIPALLSHYPDDLQEESVGLLEYLGQMPLNPPNVAGWKGHRAWLDTTLLTSRWELMGYIAYYFAEEQPELLRPFIKELCNNSNDVELVVQRIVDFFTANGFSSPNAYNRAVKAFKADIPSNYFDDGSWNLDWEEAPYQIGELMVHIGRQPEFQLM